MTDITGTKSIELLDHFKYHLSSHVLFPRHSLRLRITCLVQCVVNMQHLGPWFSLQDEDRRHIRPSLLQLAGAALVHSQVRLVRAC
jgi:hypothetical protein